MCDSMIVGLKRLPTSDKETIRLLVNERVQAMEAYPTLQAIPVVSIDELRSLEEKLRANGLWIEEWDDED